MAKSNGKGLATQEPFKVKDLGLAPAGRKKIQWAESRMPVLMALRESHQKTKDRKSVV